MIKKIKLFFVLVVVGLAVIAIYFTNSLFVPASAEAKLVYFKVEQGQSVKQVAQNLKANALIRGPFVFRVYARLKGAESRIIAGEHKLSTDMDVREVLRELTSGRGVNNEKKITIIEGWRASEIGEYLEKQRLVKKEEFLAAIKTKDWQGKYDYLRGIGAETVEGFLFPDTYRVFADAKAKDVAEKMLDNFNNKLSPALREEIGRQNKNIYEVLILASVVEREARGEEDRRLVADVFLKRLDLNIGLQSDATINYITNKRDLRPSASDLETDSPYNTYKYRGLPPGPICNPGLESIKAVVYPKKNDYFFFLMDKNGQTHYGRTFQEHQENIARYLE